MGVFFRSGFDRKLIIRAMDGPLRRKILLVRDDLVICYLVGELSASSHS